MQAIQGPTLIVRNASAEVLRVPFGGDRLIVGRLPQAGVQLDHSLVSRQHAEFWRDGDGFYHVRDLKSRNGTRVNGKPIVEAALAQGDQVGVGPFILEILDRALQHASATSTRVFLNDGSDGKISTLKEHASPQIDLVHLTALNEMTRTLMETSNANERKQILCDVMVGSQFHGRWSVIVRAAGGLDEPVELLNQAYGSKHMREPYLSRGVMRKVRDSGEAVMASNAGAGADSPQNMEVSISPQVMAMAAVACPIGRFGEKGHGIDVLYVMLPPALGSPVWLALVNLAARQFQQAEAQWQAREQAKVMVILEHELAQARHIQMDLVPKNPSFAGLLVEIGFVPCKWVGGDYVDAVRMTDGRVLLAIADVCGKGLPAAMVAMRVQTTIHVGVRCGQSLGEMMTHLSRYLLELRSTGSFVTMVAIAIDPATGLAEMVNAGHPPPLALAPGVCARQIEVDGNLPLGITSDAILVHQIALEPTELLALYSDGLTELSIAEKSMMLGIDGLGEELAMAYAAHPASVQETAHVLSQRLDELQGGHPSTDDRTFLLARRVTSA